MSEDIAYTKWKQYQQELKKLPRYCPRHRRKCSK
jgi:hypothetical protein